MCRTSLVPAWEAGLRDERQKAYVLTAYHRACGFLCAGRRKHTDVQRVAGCHATVLSPWAKLPRQAVVKP